MCTAAEYSTKHHYFGRNLDLEYSYHEEVTITPRHFPFQYRRMAAQKTHYAIIGMAFIAGGETVVHLTGKGKGGRNQELALAAAAGIDGIPGTAVFSVGSDGTDGPTDAAGGYVDYETAGALKAQGTSIYAVLQDNDAYHALEKTGGLIITGPTGTNVNDVAVALIG